MLERRWRPAMMGSLSPTEALQAAIDRRSTLLTRLHGEGTDCYRLLHGIAEDAPGLCVDRYGTLLLVQTFREPLPAADVEALRTLAADRLGIDFVVACNHRGGQPAPDNVPHEPAAAALAEQVCRERNTRFVVAARHRGLDPWLFLDLRPGRAAIERLAPGKSVLNLFAYTCGVGIVAARAGASLVQNVDFAESALAVGKRNLEANTLPPDRCTFVHSDCLPILRQLAGQPVQRRNKHLAYLRVEQRMFDLIVLDPPRFAKTAFGTIDVVSDYGSLWKPALLALAPGGTILATNHVPAIKAADWHQALRRSADKAGRPLRSLEPIAVDADFPSFDGEPPLKMVLATI